MKHNFKSSVVSDNFHADSTQFKQEAIDGFKQQGMSLVIVNSGWDEDIEHELDDLELRVDKTTHDWRERQLDKLIKNCHGHILQELEPKITYPIVNLEDNFSETIETQYKQTVTDNEKTFKDILEVGFQMKTGEYDDTVEELENKVYEDSIRMLRKTVSDLSTHIKRKFDEVFRKDSDNKPREWFKIEVDDIKSIWESSVKSMDKYFELFVEIAIPRQVSHHGQMTSRPSFDTSSDRILDDQQVQRSKDRFNDEANLALEDAIRSHYNFGQGGIPFYFWFVFLFFAYDDVWEWMQSPILFYPIFIISLLIALLYAMGFGPVLNNALFPMIRMTVNQSLRKVGLKFQI